MKKICLLGSTGSIGTSTLAVVRHLKSIQVTALAAHSNIDLLEAQAREFSPEIVAVYDKPKALELQKRLPGTRVVGGMEGVLEAAANTSAEMVISAMTGTLGLAPTIAAIEAGKHIGLANKESLVSGGALVIQKAKEQNISLIPVDSEHSAIFQCLHGQRKEAILRLILTASGGPFKNFTTDQLEAITVEQALKHPSWRMGPKITIDCSTLMNKGLEVIEAHWLFSLPIDQIDVVVHPQSFIHSMVEFVDGALLAQMGEPDMKVPIQYALTYPERVPGLLRPFDFTKPLVYNFYPPDTERFRCLSLAYQAVREGKSLACYMNAANEVLVNRFLNKEIGWLDIGRKLDGLMEKHDPVPVGTLETVYEVDKAARREASTV